MDSYDAMLNDSGSAYPCAMEGCQECSQCRPPAPKYRAVAPVREVVQQLHGLLEVHDDEFENLDLMELYCELAKVRQVLDAAQVDLTKEVVEEGRILKAFAAQSGIAYGTVQRWARQ